MNILFLAQHYAPEEVSGAVLATELATDLAQYGHSVTFVTAAPSYPQGRVFPNYRNSLLARQTLNAVQIVRVWSYISNSRAFWPRTINFLTFSFSALLGGLVAGRPNVIFSYSPPLPLGISAWLLSIIYRVPWILRVEDLFPDAAIATGILRSPIAIRAFYNLEKFLYMRAKHISVISEGFRDNIVTKGIPPEKISIEPVWANPDQITPMPKENKFREDFNLKDKFVVLYSGNIGHTSALDEVLTAAELLSEDKNFHFLIVGEGVRKANLIEEAKNRNIKNLQFLPFQPRDRLSEMLAAADISLVTLNSKSSRYSLPSKTFANMASARPILAITPKESELADLVRDADCGLVVPPNDPTAVVEALLKLKKNKNLCEHMGNLGREVLIKKYSRRNCVAQYEAMITSVYQ